MIYFITKSLLSGIIVAVVSEVAKRSPSLGGLIISLPLISIMAILWLWHDTKNVERVAAHAQATFWFVLPTLPMFLVFPLLLRHNIAFPVALIGSCMMTVMFYFLTIVIARKLGIELAA